MIEDWRRLRRAAWLALAVHVLAGAAMALVLRRGLDTNPDLADRLAFIARRRGLWVGAWAAWNAAALSILFLFYALWRARPERALRLAFQVAAAAVVADLAAELLEMRALPPLAAAALTDPMSKGVFLVTHRLAVLLTGCCANALYTAAVCVATAASWALWPRVLKASGAAVGLSGLALSLSALADSPRGMLLSNLALVPSILVWLAALARDAERRLAASR